MSDIDSCIYGLEWMGTILRICLYFCLGDLLGRVPITSKWLRRLVKKTGEPAPAQPVEADAPVETVCLDFVVCQTLIDELHARSDFGFVCFGRLKSIQDDGRTQIMISWRGDSRAVLGAVTQVQNQIIEHLAEKVDTYQVDDDHGDDDDDDDDDDDEVKENAWQ